MVLILRTYINTFYILATISLNKTKLLLDDDNDYVLKICSSFLHSYCIFRNVIQLLCAKNVSRSKSGLVNSNITLWNLDKTIFFLQNDKQV